MDYSLQTATLQDLQTVLTWIATPRALRFWGGPGLTFPPRAEAVWQAIEATDENSFSLMDRKVNLAAFGQTLIREPGTVHLARIIVSPALRGKGIGRILCQELIGAGVERYQAAAMSLNVYKDNRAALSLYQSLGFAIVSEDSKNNWYSMRLQL